MVSTVNLLQHLLAHMRHAVVLISAHDMLILEVNHAACRMLGYTREELIGQPLSSIECSLLDVFFWDDLKQCAQFSGNRTVESEWLTSDGHTLPIEKQVSSYSDGDMVCWLIQAEDITRRYQVLENQTRLASQLQCSLDATAEGIMSADLSNNVININQRFVTMWRLPEEINIARNFSETISYLLACLIDDGALTESLAQTQQDNEIETENLLALQDGRFFICISKPEYLRDQVIGRVFSVRDVTELKRSELDLIAAKEHAEAASREKSQMLDALKVTESRLRRLLNSSLIGIFQGDLDGGVFEANNELLKLIGVERQIVESGQLNWLDIIFPVHPRTHHQILDELRHAEQLLPFEAELISQCANDVYVIVGLALLEGSRHELVGFVMDITEQRRVDKIKSEFISVVSHELRTPLTAIRGALSLLEGGVLGKLPDNVMNMVSVAHKNSIRLISLVNDILDMEKLMSGKMRINLERCDLLSLAKQAIEVNAAYASSLNVSYKLESSLQQAWGMADPERIMQVFANLMSNAAKYSPSGDHVIVRVLQDKQLVRIEIQDHGAGIPESFRGQIFNKFAQADGSNTRRQGGTGLGLNITKTLIEKMGGAIGFDTEEGKGTSFWFYLPVADMNEL